MIFFTRRILGPASGATIGYAVNKLLAAGMLPEGIMLAIYGFIAVATIMEWRPGS